MAGTSNLQILAWCKKNIGPTFLGVYEENTLPSHLPHNADLVVSYGKHKVGSTDVLHWCAIKKRGKYGLWLDPMGRPPGADAADLGIRSTVFRSYMRRQCPLGVDWNRIRLEQWGGTGPGSATCGQWSCAMLKWGAPQTNPQNWRWLTPSLRKNNATIREMVKL